MKSFKEFMTENGGHVKSLGGDGGAQNQYGRWGQEPVHMGVHRIEDPNVMQRLNAHVGLVNTREYIDPRSALEHVQNALMRLGYHFEYNLNDIPNEQNVYPLNRFGGRKGFLDMDAVVKEDDGIEQAVGESMVLRVEFVQDADTARYEVFAQIVPASLFGEDDVQPEAIKPNRASVASTAGDSDGINMGESVVYVGEAVSISTGQEKGQGTFEVKFDFRGGPTKRQAQKFALAAQKRLAGASFTPNRKGSSETVVVTVKAGSPRDAQVKARKVLDGVKESVDHINEADETVRRIFTFTDKKTAQRFIRSIDLRAKFTSLDHAHTKTPEVAATFKNLADAGEATKIAKKLGSTRTEEFVAEAQKFIATFPTKTTRNQALADTQKLPSGLRTNASAMFPGAGPANGVLFWVSDNGLQTRDLMKLIKKNKGTVVSSKTESVFNESLSRTFAFASADSRNRIEKLLGLASGDSVSTSDKGKGKFKFTVTAMLRGPQIDKIMNSVKQLKGKLAEEQIYEDLSRTFAFTSADARDRIESLLGLASKEKVSTADKGKGKFKFTVTAMLKGPQIDKIMNSVKQLKGKLAENTTQDMANNAVRDAIRERAERLHERDPFPVKEASAFIEAGLKHARDAVGGGKQFVSVSGKMSEKKASQTIRGAAKFLKQHGTPADKKLAAKALGEATKSKDKKRDTSEDCDLSHDENDKENRRTKKDNTLASVENADPMIGRVKEQISKRKKRTAY